MKTKPNHEGISLLRAETSKSRSTNMASYIRGVTTLHHYERISSRDLGLEKLRVFRTEVILAFLGGFTVEMM